MAFQLVLAELHAHQDDLKALQQTVQQMLPLLAKIVGLLEAHGHQPEVPVATWDQMYAGAEAVLAPPVHVAVNATPVAPTLRALLGPKWLAQWFVKETPSGDA
jgi:hypothetical protein